MPVVHCDQKMATKTQRDLTESTSQIKMILHWAITINEKEVPSNDSAKYPGVTRDARLRLKAHVEVREVDVGTAQSRIQTKLN